MGSRALLLWATAIGATLATLFYFLLEIKEEETDLGWRPEAILNPVLAAEMLLERQSMPVRSADRLNRDEALPPRGTLYISDASQVLTPRDTGKLLTWIGEGGHLILSATTTERDHPLLTAFGIEVYSCGCGPKDTREDLSNLFGPGEVDAVEEDDDVVEDKPLSERMREFNRELRELADSEEEEDTYETPDDELTKLAFGGVEEVLNMDFGTSVVIRPLYRGEPEEEVTGQGQDRPVEPQWQNPPVYSSGTDAGLHFAQFELDDGLFTLMAGSTVWHNWQIEENDHAYLLWLLAAEDAETLLLYGLYSPSLWELMWKYWPELIMSIWLLILVALWGYLTRFGPVLDVSRSERRGLLEHLRGCGEYCWQYGRSRALLEPMVEDIERRATRLLPRFASAPGSEQLAILSEISGLDEAEIAAAMKLDPGVDTLRFTQQVRTLHAVRNSL